MQVITLSAKRGAADPCSSTKVTVVADSQVVSLATKRNHRNWPEWCNGKRGERHEWSGSAVNMSRQSTLGELEADGGIVSKFHGILAREIPTVAQLRSPLHCVAEFAG